MPKQLYRGVSAAHPALSAARSGAVSPGNPSGTTTPTQHNLGGHAANSPFTCWTRDRVVAATHAVKQGAGGVVLDVAEGAPPAGAQWSWELLPDVWGEQEVLLKGPRSGLGVTKP